MLISTVSFFYLIPKQPKDPVGGTSFFAALDVYYFTYIIIFILFATGVNIQIFRKFSINYTFIFEIDQNYKLIHHQIYRVALSFCLIWFFCLAWTVGMIKIDIIQPESLQIFTISLLVLFVLLCFNPFHCCYQRGRKAAGNSLIQILLSPFGLVRFRHFFLADVLTSIITPLCMLGTIECFYFGQNQDWRIPATVNLSAEC